MGTRTVSRPTLLIFKEFLGEISQFGVGAPNPENLGSAIEFNLFGISLNFVKKNIFSLLHNQAIKIWYHFEEKLRPWNYFFLQIRLLISQNTIVICSCIYFKEFSSTFHVTIIPHTLKVSFNPISGVPQKTLHRSDSSRHFWRKGTNGRKHNIPSFWGKNTRNE